MTNAHRTVQDNANFFKTALPIVRINVESVIDGNKDQTVLAFSHDHNLGIENNDAYKMKSNNKNVPSIYTVVDGVPLCINRLPNPKTYYSIPMGFESRLLGEVYEFSVVKEEINPDWTIYLEDHKLGQLHNLAASNYRFQNVGEATNRFTIHINKYPENLSGSNLNKVAIYADENGINVAFNYMESEEAEVTISTLSGNLLFSGTISTAQNFTYPVNDQIALYVVHVNYRNGLTYAKVLR